MIPYSPFFCDQFQFDTPLRSSYRPFQRIHMTCALTWFPHAQLVSGASLERVAHVVWARLNFVSGFHSNRVEIRVLARLIKAGMNF